MNEEREQKILQIPSIYVSDEEVDVGLFSFG